MSIEQLIDDTKRLAKKAKIKLRISDGEYVQFDETRSNGYFDPENRVFAVARNKNFLDTFIHESCHMDQWLESSPISAEYDAIVTPLMFSVLAGTEPYLGNEELFKRQVELSRDLELDCERRTVAKIKAYGITEIDTDVYTRKANSYIYFYTYLLEKQKWYEIGREPYSVDEVWQLAPNHFNNDYSVIPDDLKQAFDKYL